MNQSKTDTYHIFGRTAYSEPLAFVGSVSVGPEQELEMPDGADWVEVIAIPEEAIIQVIPEPKKASR